MWGASRWDRRKRPRNRGYYLETQGTPDFGHRKERLSAVMQLVSALGLAWPERLQNRRDLARRRSLAYRLPIPLSRGNGVDQRKLTI